ncbi:GIDE domain-containing protein [Natrialba sp. SSL1]|uniref:GIDE domain-containing protein n=1 Tax=Natrialba sp. SSL1 TaxID=1869245 RepID=UPI0008F8A8F3|nr:GIDE domain-containing protein [Natrialba sp. SSL1]OIB56494.1 autotransporter [Natrialba sp. SSL1]
MISTITGLDLVALVLLGHIWAVFVALAIHADNADPDPESGARWAGRRFSLGTRLYAGTLLVATLVVWLPFAVGGYPFWPEAADSGTARGAFFATALGGIAIGGGFYLLAGGVVAAVTSYRLRQEGPTAIGGVDDGLITVSGTVIPTTDSETSGGTHTSTNTLTTPLTGTIAVWYQLTATDADTATPSSFIARLSSLLATRLRIGTANETQQLECDHVPFVLEDDTGQIRVDPAHAAVALESTTTRVRASETPPDRLAAWLRDARYAADVDQERTYHETVLEPGAEVTVTGIARSKTADSGAAVDPTVATDGIGATPATETDGTPLVIAARKPTTELFIESGCDQTALARAWFRGTVDRGVLWGLAMIAAGSAALWWMALSW